MGLLDGDHLMFFLRRRLPLNLDDDRQYQRAALELLVDEFGDVVVEILLQQGDLPDLVLRRVGQRVLNHLVQLVAEVVCLLGEGDAAEDHLRLVDLGAVVGGDGGDDDEDAVVGELAPVADCELVGLADGDAVDEDHPGVDVLAEAGAFLVDLQARPVAPDEDGVLVDPYRLGQVRVEAEPLVVPVEGHDVFGLVRFNISLSSSCQPCPRRGWGHRS